MKRRTGPGSTKSRRQRPATPKRVSGAEAVGLRGSSPADNGGEIARLASELRAAREQQGATADVLKVISRSAFDLPRVLETLAELAVRLCDADHAWVFRRDGEVYRWAAGYGHSKEEHASLTDYFKDHDLPPDRGTVTGRTALEGRPVQVADVVADPDYRRHDVQRIGNYRTGLGIPLLREGVPIGVLALTRSQPQVFTDRQIELLITFADQAVIAIENTRLLNELRQRTDDLTELLEQQTATSEVLKVISSSPGDSGPVFQTMLENAVRLCEAKFGLLFLYDEGEREFRAAATWNLPTAYAENV